MQVTGEQRLDHDWTVDNSTKYWFSVGPGNCSTCPQICPMGCLQSKRFDNIGYDCSSPTCQQSGSGDLVNNNNNVGDSINISISAMSGIGTHGFAVLLYNPISSVKFEPGSSSSDWGLMTPAHEDIQVGVVSGKIPNEGTVPLA